MTIESEGEFDYDEFAAAIKETFPEPDTIGLILAKKTYTAAVNNINEMIFTQVENLDAKVLH